MHAHKLYSPSLNFAVGKELVQNINHHACIYVSCVLTYNTTFLANSLTLIPYCSHIISILQWNLPV